jgi:hypothetical protein
LPPTESDGIYTPISNREIYTKIALDYQEIISLTRVVNEGKPLPSQEILKVYEESKLARLDTQTRLLRGFAREDARSREFPNEMAFFCSSTWLDDPVIAAILGTGPAAKYSPEQRQAAIQKGVLRIVQKWSSRYIALGGSPTPNPELVDESWAIYVGQRRNGKYPDSVAGEALAIEAKFNRRGSLDAPIRAAMYQAHKSAADKNAAAYTAAEREVYSRWNTMYYLGIAWNLNEALKAATAGNGVNAGARQVEAYYYYLALRATVAKLDPAADATLMAYFEAAPSTLTKAKRDVALVALNKAAGALLLKPADMVTPATLR